MDLCIAPNPSRPKTVDVIEPGDLCSRATTPNDRKLLKDVCAQLRRTEDLAEVLKYPFCTGEEEIVFNQLNSKTQRDSWGVWKFVEQADSLGKDVDSPAKRPSVQDAL